MESNIKKGNIVDIFPSPVYQIQLDESDFTNEEEFLKNFFLKSCAPCESGSTSLITAVKSKYSSYVLNFPEVIKLKTILEKYSEIFMSEIMGYEDGARITTSWIHLYRKNSKLEAHMHPNSIITGVYYMNVPENAKILFHKKMPYSSPHYELLPKKNNNSNSKYSKEIISINVKKSSLLIFPSNIPHSVEENKNEEDRWCVAFNVITKNGVYMCLKIYSCIIIFPS